MLFYWECESRCLSETVAVEVHELIQRLFGNGHLGLGLGFRVYHLLALPTKARILCLDSL
jgi:hypothetical protein